MFNTKWQWFRLRLGETKLSSEIQHYTIQHNISKSRQSEYILTSLLNAITNIDEYQDNHVYKLRHIFLHYFADLIIPSGTAVDILKFIFNCCILSEMSKTFYKPLFEPKIV